MSLVDVLYERSELKDRGITFIESSTSEDFLSYNALYSSALKVLSYLQQKGVAPKSELVFQIDDNKSFLVVFWACILGGIIPVPLTVGRKDDQINKFHQVWLLLKKPYLIISRDHFAQLGTYLENNGLHDLQKQVANNLLHVEDIFSANELAVVQAPATQDIAFIQFSSGSTGNPKGVILTHDNLIANVSGIAAAASYCNEDSLLSWMPLTHDMGMIGFHISPLFSAVNQYLMPTNLFVRNPRLWLDKVTEHKVTVTSSPNFGYRYLLKYLTGKEDHWDLSNVRIIYNGAEPISEKLCHEFNGKLSQFGLRDTAMCPVYGLAEASVAVAISGIDDKVQALHLNRLKINAGDVIEETDSLSIGSSFVNVGKPVNHCSVQITNEKNEKLADNIIGQVRIMGANVTSGYYNNTNAYSDITDEEGWLNTGDLGFIRAGNLYITGRAKDVIFSNGQNYYAHDIEREAEAVEGIALNRIAVCGTFNADKQTEELVVFLLYRAALQELVPVARSLKLCINEKFGIEINKIVPVKHIPKTTSGKLQRFKLRQLYQEGAFGNEERELADLLHTMYNDTIVDPANEMEVKLLEIWKTVLHNEKIHVESKFIEVGGDSLKAAELIIRLQHEFEVGLPIEKLYECQTVRRLAGEIDSLAHKDYQPMPKASLADAYPVSASQRRMYYAWKLMPEAIAYNMPVAIWLKGRVHAERLSACLTQLVNRHDALRMTFFMENEPRLRVSEQVAVKLNIIPCEEADWDDQLKALVVPFDLANGPLFRFSLLQPRNAAHSKYLLFLDFHHIISDGQSVYWFIDELLSMYSGMALPGPVPVSFRDFICWERVENNMLNETVKQYWTDRFTGELPVLEIARDFARPALLSLAGKRQVFHLNNTIASKLKQISIDHQVTRYSVYFTLYSILLAKYSAQEDIIIGIPAHGRVHPDLQQVQGMFVNNLPIRNAINGKLRFTDLLKNTSRLISEAIDRQNIPFDELVNLVNAPAHPGRSPLFDTMFLYQGPAINSRQVPGVDIGRYLFDPGFSKFDISMEIFEQGNKTDYAFEYSTELFTNETILALHGVFENILNQVTANPDIRIEDISALNEKDYHEFYVAFNSTDKNFEPFIPVQELFERQVQQDPDRIAIEFEGEQLSYEALNDKADQVAAVLINKGIRKGSLVGVHLKRSPQLVCVILGILKAGAAYLPLESEMPAARIQFIVADSGCQWLVTDAPVTGIAAKGGSAVEVLAVDSLFSSTGSRQMPERINGSDLAYVIYTSGTTGQPKGVMIGHGSFLNYITWASSQYVGREHCSFALYSSISFDLTVTSLFLPLVTGGKMIIYGEDDTQISIEHVIRENVVDIIKLTPSHLRLLKENNLLLSAKVKKFIVGGEALHTDLARHVYEQMEGDIEIFNEYGPTEATVGCMIYKFDPTDTRTTVPIGRPIANTQIYLLNKYLKPVPANVPGEIYIAGKGLAKGYLFQEQLTGDTFIDNPFVKGEKMYKTGDIARRLHNGDLEYIGRNDKQVKIGGNRIELSEIESQLMRSGKIRDVVVLVAGKDQDHLHAYYTPLDSDSPLSEISIRNYLAEKLPYYMIPREFIAVPAMPVTRNGKIDNDKLLSFKPADADVSSVTPANELERMVMKIWADVLNIDHVGITDNFFEQGGDSIKAVQISSRLYEEGIAVKVKDILTYHTIKNICQRAERVSGRHVYEQAMVEGRFLPTPIQSWFFSRRFSNPNYYNQSVLLAIKQPLDHAILEQTFNALIEYHDTLRVNYDAETHSFFYNNDHLKKKHTISEFIIDDEHSLIEICNQLRGTMDISGSLLIRMAIIKAQDGRSFLFVTAHHLVMDGVSWRILLEDFYNVYTALADGRAIHFPPKTASFKNWSAAVDQLQASGVLNGEREYWKEIQATGFELPGDFAVTDMTIRKLRKVTVGLDKETTEYLLKGAHRSYNTDVPILLNTALVIALNQWMAQDEFVIEQENHGRHLESLDVSRTIGWFTTMYPVKLVYREDIGMLIKSVKEAIRKVPHNGIGYGINAFGFAERGRAPELSQIRLNYLGQFGSELSNRLLSLAGDMTGTEADPRNSFTARLECNAMIAGGAFQMEIIYSAGMYRDSTVNELAQRFVSSLERILLYLKNEQDLHFTPSDFSADGLDEEAIRAIFGNS